MDHDEPPCCPRCGQFEPYGNACTPCVDRFLADLETGKIRLTANPDDLPY
jgi:hypothetical protein